MAAVVNGGAAQAGEEAAAPAAQPRDGQVVVVRSEVLDNVGHVLGNLFQRIYHLVDRVGEADALTAEELRGSASRLEGFLQLFMDYVAPLPLTLQYVTYTDVAQSLARSLSDAFGGRVRVHVNAPSGGEVLVDPGRLSRVFDLLSTHLQGRPGSEQSRAIKVSMHAVGRCVRLTVTMSSGFVTARASERELQWAVAEKLVETHGGTLEQNESPSGEVLWEITLPLQS